MANSYSYVASYISTDACMTPGGNISFVAVGATAGGNIISVALIDTCFSVSISSAKNFIEYIIRGIILIKLLATSSCVCIYWCKGATWNRVKLWDIWCSTCFLRLLLVLGKILALHYGIYVV